MWLDKREMEKVNGIAIIICNYNKKEYVKMNLESLRKQTKDDFDVFLVDNASTDGSFEEFSSYDGIKLIHNTENLGGSGGFNSGLKAAMKSNYKYMVLLDNDVVLKEDCIERLFNDMENNPNVGIMGAMILKMDHPEIIQEFGPTIDYENMTFILHHGGEKCDIPLPDIMKCDYVPACALIVRRQTIEKIGYMPEENFIYYDDIVWGVRCARSGYDVAANSKAIVWHKGGAKINPTTFSTYYLARNKTYFFMGNSDHLSCDEKEKRTEILAERILYEMFEGIYACISNNRPNLARTRFEAFLDVIAGIRGKASDKRIRDREDPKKGFKDLIKNKKSILIYTHGRYESTRRLLGDIRDIEITDNVSYDIKMIGDKEDIGQSIRGIEIKKDLSNDGKEYNLIVHICDHIYDEVKKDDSSIWVDGWANVIADEQGYEMYRQFPKSYEIFRFCFWDKVCECIKDYTEAEIAEYGNN